MSLLRNLLLVANDFVDDDVIESCREAPMMLDGDFESSGGMPNDVDDGNKNLCSVIIK